MCVQRFSQITNSFDKSVGPKNLTELAICPDNVMFDSGQL